MQINDDLSEPVIVHAARQDWVPSPSAGVDRRMLYREGDEVARATSIVRYAPGSAFPSHTHHGGEEILVLDGTFQDKHGDYPAGCYFRNPPGTAHQPAAEDGCTIFVRLRQFRAGDDVQIVRQPDEGERVALRDGAKSTRLLFADQAERVVLEEWTPGAAVTVENAQGLEFIVVAGEFTAQGETLEPQSWARLPVGQALEARVGSDGATLWMKEAPLRHRDILAIPG